MEEQWWSSEEACAHLGIKRATLYAYASRGLVRARSVQGTRAKLYARADIERLATRAEAHRGHTAVAAAAMRWGEPVLDSAITEIDGKRLWYRGHDAVELAKRARFEDVAGLLIDQLDVSSSVPASEQATLSPPGVPVSEQANSVPVSEQANSVPVSEQATLSAPGVPVSELRRVGRSLRGVGRPIDRMLIALPQLGCGAFAIEPREGPFAPFAMSVVRALIACLAEAPDRVVAQRTLARAFLTAYRRSHKHAPAIDRALVLCADHELNTSSFAARVAASSGASIVSCLLAAMATVTGPLHGGATEHIEALVDEAARKGAAKAVRERLRRGEAVPGFTHRLYPEGDPRAVPILRSAARIAPEVRLFRDLARAMRHENAGEPAVDFALVALTRALRLPDGTALAIFALGRTAGYVAHVVEQRAAGFLLRPRARYVTSFTPKTAGG